MGNAASVGIAATLALLLAASPAIGASAATDVLRTGLPSPVLTPGTRNPAVTQLTIKTTICVSGWTASIRPSSGYTTALKKQQLATYGFADRDTSHYEEDHLISLELGGAPKDPRNLWPEPYHVKLTGTDLGAYAKDGFENWLKRAVCNGRLSLASAQLRITSNWVKYWRSAGSP